MPLYSELHHSRPQRTRIQAQDLRGAEWSLDAPAGVFECANDVVAFYFFKRLRRRQTVRGRLIKLIDNLKRAPVAMYDGSLDDVRQLSDIARPCVSLQTLHRSRRDRQNRLAKLLRIRRRKMLNQQ